ncbi:MAG: tRNA (N(6)-L-threonylcarbamoyladenosine(37)-C(2))-methylthiotransferase MtaB [Acidobacteriia bacterium]|nr:tRNA (N(6)-L-threonylcarbamoyladenosine(37)-C(2))-methylthiotransferase MtaB [Terriglobia bacterium]
MSSFYVENFGCRATQADGAAIERQLRERGLERAPQPEEAQVVVLNTCTVTASADQDVRAAIRRIYRGNPECKILVTGCYAQRAPQELAALPGVRWVIGNSHKQQVGDVVCGGEGFVPLGMISPAQGGRATPPPQVIVGDIFAHTELLAAPVFDGGADKTRPNLKVQDGCDNRCSFCIIPSVRGASRSLPMAEVLAQVGALVRGGFREVVISGINLGRWGRDFAQPDRFVNLVRAIMERTELEKLRLSSVEPMDWTPELIELAAGCERIAKHAHVPMQSGSDRVLRAMHRKYRPWHYAEKIRRIRQAMPAAAIGADVMVGFPGETEADFAETRRMIEELPLTYLHVFTYSSRPGTRSAAMPNPVPVQVARERNRVLRALAAEKKRGFMNSFVGRELPAITLSVGDDHSTEALTDNYLKMRLAGRHAANQWVGAQVQGVRAEVLFATVV